MAPPHHQLPVDNPNDERDARAASFSSNVSSYWRRHGAVTSPKPPQHTRRRQRRSRRGGRSAYDDVRRVEVAAVRAVGACNVCKRRKVRCTHVLNLDGSPRKPLSDQSKHHGRSTRGSLEDPDPDEISQGGYMAKKIVRQPTLIHYLEDLEDDPAARRFVPLKSQSPEAEAQQRIGSRLGKLSNNIPTQWQNGPLPEDIPPSSMGYPTELPDDREMVWNPEPVKYSQPQQTFQGPAQTFQAITSADDNWQQNPVFIFRPSNALSNDGYITGKNSYSAPYGQTNHLLMVTPNQMHLNLNISQRNTMGTSVPTFSHVAIPTNQLAPNYSQVLSQPHTGLQARSFSNDYTNTVPPAQQSYDTEDVLSNLEPVPSLDFGSSHYGTVIAQDYLSNNGDAGMHATGFDQTFSLMQPEISPEKPLDVNSLAGPMDVDSSGSWTDLLNSISFPDMT